MITTAVRGDRRRISVEEIQPRFAAQAEVDQRHVEPLALDGLDGVGGRRGLLDRVPHRLEGDPQGLPDVRLVVNDEDSHGSRAFRGGSSFPIYHCGHHSAGGQGPADRAPWPITPAPA